jgi:hypothetical protein
MHEDTSERHIIIYSYYKDDMILWRIDPLLGKDS